MGHRAHVIEQNLQIKATAVVCRGVVQDVVSSLCSLHSHHTLGIGLSLGSSESASQLGDFGCSFSGPSNGLVKVSLGRRHRLFSNLSALLQGFHSVGGGGGSLGDVALVLLRVVNAAKAAVNVVLQLSDGLVGLGKLGGTA